MARTPAQPALSIDELAAAIGQAPAGPRDRKHLDACLGRLPQTGASPAEAGEAVIRDGVRILPLRWSLGYGPVTEAWLLTPADGAGPWPGVVALHDHGGYRYLGKEKIADGPDGIHPAMVARGGRPGYDDRPWANDLARSGFAVLVHDVCTWGSRRFPAADLQQAEGAWTPGKLDGEPASDDAAAINAYNAAANEREHTLVKWCQLMGTSFPGLVAHEDRCAIDVLTSRPECLQAGVGAVGHSGGGARAALLAATDQRVEAAVVSCMMTTYAGLLRHRTWLHTWQFLPPGWAPGADWPDVLALRAGMPAMVCFGEIDGGFDLQAMRDADQALTDAWQTSGHASAYQPLWHAGGHIYPRDVQTQVATWLASHLGA